MEPPSLPQWGDAHIEIDPLSSRNIFFHSTPHSNVKQFASSIELNWRNTLKALYSLGD